MEGLLVVVVMGNTLVATSDRSCHLVLLILSWEVEEFWLPGAVS